MALKLKITLPTGVEAEYWRLGLLTADRVRGVMIARLDLYITKEARDNGMAPVKSQTMRSTVRIDGVEENYVTEAYRKIKEPVFVEDEDSGEEVQVNPFVVAEDVLE